MEILDHLLDQEVKNLNSRHVEIRMRYSGIPFRKTIEMFDFSFQPSIDRSHGIKVHTQHGKHRVLRPPGVGKTHLSTDIEIQAMQSGIPAYYIHAVKLVQILKKDFDTSRINYRMTTYSKFSIMIVDEIGYLPMTREEPSLFFQFVSYRYERRSSIYTSNKSFSEWDEILGDQVMASAVLDRILHHCTVVKIRGKSFRLKERKKIGNTGLREVK